MFLQMLVAGIASLISSSINTCVIFILTLKDITIKDIFYKLDVFINGWSVELVVCVPICMSSLLCIHFTGIFKYIMYSNKMVIFETTIFTLSKFFIHYKILLEGQYFKSVLLFSFVIVLYSAFIIKKFFFKRYVSFQKEISRLEMKPKISEKVDIAITIVSNIIILIPCLTFVYILSLLLLVEL